MRTVLCRRVLLLLCYCPLKIRGGERAEHIPRGIQLLRELAVRREQFEQDQSALRAALISLLLREKSWRGSYPDKCATLPWCIFVRCIIWKRLTVALMALSGETKVAHGSTPDLGLISTDSTRGGAASLV